MIIVLHGWLCAVYGRDAGTGSVDGILFFVQSGKGIPAATVTIGTGRNIIYTSADGSFTFPDMAAGDYPVSVSFAGNTIKNRGMIEVFPGKETYLKIRILPDSTMETSSLVSQLPSGAIRGRVLGAKGAVPIAGAEIKISGSEKLAVSDPQGYYLLPNIAAGTYSVSASVEGCPVVFADDVYVAAGDSATIDLVPGLPLIKPKTRSDTNAETSSIVGKIFDKKTNRPVSAATISLSGRNLTTATDETGSFRLSPVERGCYQLSVNAASYGSFVVSSVPCMPLQVCTVLMGIAPGQTAEYDVELHPWAPGTVTGMVVDSRDRRPVAGAMVSTGRPGDTVFSDSGGVYLLTDFDPGTYRLRASADSFPEACTLSVTVYENQTVLRDIALGSRVLSAGIATVSAVSDAPKKEWRAVSGESGGSISGFVAEAIKGKGLDSALVTLDSTDASARTNRSGRFTLSNIKPGDYSVLVSSPGYLGGGPVRISVYGSPERDTFSLRFILKPDTVASLGLITVTARARANTDVSLLRERQRAAVVSDGISGIEMGRAAVSNAADAMKKVTGASVMDGKYVFVRGLGERYNITLLDGAVLPSIDPDSRAVPMDIFPAALMDNITTVKTFSPELPGDFSGGCINIVTKQIPEKPVFTLSAGSGANTITTGSTDFLAYKGGKLDWLGFDDGTRAIPEHLRDTSMHIPTKSDALWGDSAHSKAMLLDSMTRAFTPIMTPNRVTALPNQSYSLFTGNTFNLFDRMPLGMLGSLSYSRKSQMYTGGVKNNWEVGSSYTDTDSLELTKYYYDNKSVNEVLWGGLGRFTLEPFTQQRLQADLLYVRHGEDAAQEKNGPADESSAAAGSTIISSMLHYKEQGLGSFSLKGGHKFDSLTAGTRFEGSLLDGLRLDWRFADINASQNEPDMRFFFRSFNYNEDSTDKLWVINNTIYTSPTRYFRELTEHSREWSASASLAIGNMPGDTLTLQSGVGGNRKTRDFSERRFFYQQGFFWDDDPATFLFSDSILGLIDTIPSRKLGNYIVDGFEKKNNYHGNASLFYSFLSAEARPFDFLRTITGVRYERFDLYSASRDTTQTITIPPDTAKIPIWYARLAQQRFFPSINIIASPAAQMNLRASFSQTTLRPSMREITPYENYDFYNEYKLRGNLHLKPTLCSNYDLRFEWFRRAGELLSAGCYYKFFNKPIVLADDRMQNDLVTPQNAPSGYALGFELEIKTALDLFSPALRDFSLGCNAAVIRARMKKPETEIRSVSGNDTLIVPRERDYFGQSPYVLNTNISYTRSSSGTTASLYYNVSGPRIVLIKAWPEPDVYELPFHQLDASVSQKLSGRVSLRAAASNILGLSARAEQKFKERSYQYQKKAKGTNYSLTCSVSLQ